MFVIWWEHVCDMIGRFKTILVSVWLQCVLSVLEVSAFWHVSKRLCVDGCVDNNNIIGILWNFLFIIYLFWLGSLSIFVTSMKHNYLFCDTYNFTDISRSHIVQLNLVMHWCWGLSFILSSANSSSVSEDTGTMLKALSATFLGKNV